MFIFASFVQNINFQRSKFQKMSVELSEFYLLVLSLLRVLGEICFKAPKVPLGEFFTTDMLVFPNFVEKKLTLSDHSFQNVDTALPEFYLLVLSLLRVLWKSLFIQKFRWTNIFALEMSIFIKFVQKN